MRNASESFLLGRGIWSARISIAVEFVNVGTWASTNCPSVPVINVLGINQIGSGTTTMRRKSNIHNESTGKIDQLHMCSPFGVGTRPDDMSKVLVLGVVFLDALHDETEISVTAPLLLSLPSPQAIV